MREELKECVDEKRTYGRTIRVLLGCACSLVGTILALYVGGWMMIFKPVEGMVLSYMAGTLTIRGVILTAVKCILSTTAAGAIWCGGYILKNKFIGHPEY